MKLLNVTNAHSPHVALVSFNRPKELNALNPAMMQELSDTLIMLDKSDDVRAIILTGNERAFAAGADIKQMADQNAMDMLLGNQFDAWEQLRRTSKPLIAAVSGFALGGGCEVALACDMIVASETAQFGLPEVKLGTIPGAGGTQRLTHAVGKARAMELILTGRHIDANEALSLGLVSRVVPVEAYLTEATLLATKIAAMSPVAIRLAKEAINRSFEAHLDEGLAYERKQFFLTFASEDRKEGMNAFVEKRRPNFKGK